MTTLGLSVAVSESHMCGTGRLRPSDSDNASAEYIDANSGVAQRTGEGSLYSWPIHLPCQSLLREARTIIFITVALCSADGSEYMARQLPYA